MCESANKSDLEEIMELDMDVNNPVLPEKSKKMYEKSYNRFMSWRTANEMKSFSESVVLCYFRHMAKNYRASSLWSEFSKLKATLLLKHQINIGNYTKVNAFLKDTGIGYTVKKSKTFLPHEIEDFLNRAPDVVYLSTKVALIFGILGACRRQELHELKYKNVKDLNRAILVNIKHTSESRERTFTIQGKFYEMCKRYMDLRPDNCQSPKFFIRYYNGKCADQNVGINTFGNMGKTIAIFLNLPNPETYTGHCFRRTSATLSIVPSEDMMYLAKHNRVRDTADESIDSTTQDASTSRSLRGSISRSMNESQFVEFNQADPDSSIENVDWTTTDSHQLLVSVKTERTDNSQEIDPFSDNSVNVYDSDDSGSLQGPVEVKVEQSTEIDIEQESDTDATNPLKIDEDKRPSNTEENNTDSASHTQLLQAILTSVSHQERVAERAARAQEAQAHALNRIALLLEQLKGDISLPR